MTNELFPPESVASVTFGKLGANGRIAAQQRDVPTEAPIAISFLGAGYAVMMATPFALGDFVIGFALSERLIDEAADITQMTFREEGGGILVNAELIGARHDRVLDRLRHRIGDSSCGMCGIENLEQALRPLPRLPAPPAVAPAALFRAVAELRLYQPLNAATGAVHAAAFCSPDGEVQILREDVGRHNAFDKLIGFMLRSKAPRNSGFALLTSRCSYELVEKAALAGISLLATISAPTSLAVERARLCGLTLIALARSDSLLIANDPHGLFRG